jgi:hypothetical protein
MVSVNTLIVNALKKVGLVGDRETPNGTLVKLALADLNSLVAELNLQDYIAETRKTVKVQSTGDKITIGDGPFAINEKLVPETVVTVARKIGNRYVRLIRSNLTAINSKTKMTLATQFTYGQEYDEENDCMVGVITTDSNRSWEYLVIYNSKIPEYKMKDTIKLSDMTCTMLEDGLAYKLAVRKKLPDVDLLKSEFDSYKDLVERTNTNNRPLVENDLFGSYMDSFENGMAGFGW